MACWLLSCESEVQTCSDLTSVDDKTNFTRDEEDFSRHDGQTWYKISRQTSPKQHNRVDANNYYANWRRVKLTSMLFSPSFPFSLLLLLRWKTRLRLLLWRDLGFGTTSCLNSIRLHRRSNKSYCENIQSQFMVGSFMTLDVSTALVCCVIDFGFSSRRQSFPSNSV